MPWLPEKCEQQYQCSRNSCLLPESCNMHTSFYSLQASIIWTFLQCLLDISADAHLSYDKTTSLFTKTLPLRWYHPSMVSTCCHGTFISVWSWVITIIVLLTIENYSTQMITTLLKFLWCNFTFLIQIITVRWTMPISRVVWYILIHLKQGRLLRTWNFHFILKIALWHSIAQSTIIVHIYGGLASCAISIILPHSYNNFKSK